MTVRDPRNEGYDVTPDNSSALAGSVNPTQREFLFGRLLLELGFVDQSTVDEVLRQSKADPQTAFADIIVLRGLISDQQRSHIDMLLDGAKAIGDLPTVSLNQSLVSTTIAYVPRHDHGVCADQHFGDYELLEEIARGGMGVIYKARQTKLGRIVALKMILSGEFSDEEQIKRFHAEAEAAAMLDHPGIVPVHEAGQVGGRHFFSMAFVPGKSLYGLVREQGPLVPKQAARIMKSAADAVQYAHERGIIHRDIKPGNILLDEQQQPRVTDFGLAKRVEVPSELTATGQIMGTPSYMPPEQAAGNTNEISHIADVYSLGATLYFLLVGRPPFQSPSQIETARQVINTAPISLRRLDPSIPRDIETICLKCLRKEIDKRYPSASALADDLQRWLDGKPIEARRASWNEKAWLWCKRRPAIASLLAVLFMVVVGGALLFHERQNSLYASGLVEALVKADVEQVPGLVKELGRYRRWADPLLRQRLAAAREGSVEQLYLRLALLPVDTSNVSILQEELLARETKYLGIIRDGLQPFQSQFVDSLWEIIHDKQQSEDRRFRAGLELVSYATQSDNWTAADATFLAEQLVAANVEHQSRLREYLRPIQDRLLTDLERIFADPTASEVRQLSAANALADYAVEDPVLLARLLTLATPGQFAVLYPLVTEARNAAAKKTLTDLVRESPAADLSPLARVELGRRRAAAAITLLRQGERETIFDALRVQDDPEALTQFVHRSRQRGIVPKDLLESLQRADALRQAATGDARRTEDRVLFGLLLALGEFELTDLPETGRQLLIDQLTAWYASDPSSAIHGACGWLLRQWKQDGAAQKVDQTPVPYSSDREWYTIEVKALDSGVSAAVLPDPMFYLTFVVIPAGEYAISSPTADPLRIDNVILHKVRLTRSIAILDREIARGEFEASGVKFFQGAEQYSPSPLHTMLGPSWYDSVRFCRWLGERVGLTESQQAYPDPAGLDANEFPANPDPLANGLPLNWPVRLEADGFRLPTQVEWEVACHSRALSSYSFGGDASLLESYGWFAGNSLDRVQVQRQKRPNLRGLFDMHGNVDEWCHDSPVMDKSDFTDPNDNQSGRTRANRGGGWGDVRADCRTAFASSAPPTSSYIDLGFRVVQVLSEP